MSARTLLHQSGKISDQQTFIVFFSTLPPSLPFFPTFLHLYFFKIFPPLFLHVVVLKLISVLDTV